MRKTGFLYILHRLSSRHRLAVEYSEFCGCFYCMKRFRATEIIDWTDDEETAHCPHCGIDAVLPGTVASIKDEVLEAMHLLWFESIAHTGHDSDEKGEVLRDEEAKK